MLDTQVILYVSIFYTLVAILLHYFYNLFLTATQGSGLEHPSQHHSSCIYSRTYTSLFYNRSLSWKTQARRTCYQNQPGEVTPLKGSLVVTMCLRMGAIQYQWLPVLTCLHRITPSPTISLNLTPNSTPSKKQFQLTSPF